MPAKQLDIYRRMLRIERTSDATPQADPPGAALPEPIIPGAARKVIPATVSSLLTKDDKICTIYRGIHDMVGKDMPLRRCGPRFAGGSTALARAKGGPMHLTHPETGVMVTTGMSAPPCRSPMASHGRRCLMAASSDGRLFW